MARGDMPRRTLIGTGAECGFRPVDERSSPDALKPTELEFLSGTRWRLMVVPSAFNKFERGAQQFPE